MHRWYRWMDEFRKGSSCRVLTLGSWGNDDGVRACLVFLNSRVRAVTVHLVACSLGWHLLPLPFPTALCCQNRPMIVAVTEEPSTFGNPAFFHLKMALNYMPPSILIPNVHSSARDVPPKYLQQVVHAVRGPKMRSIK